MEPEQIYYRGERVDGRGFTEGIYYKHLPYTPSPIGDPGIKDEDYEHYLIHPTFSDWQMPRNFTAVQVKKDTLVLSKNEGVTK